MAAVARTLGHLLGPTGGAVRQNVLAAAAMEEKSEDTSDDDDFAARVAYRKAKKRYDQERNYWR